MVLCSTTQHLPLNQQLVRFLCISLFSDFQLYYLIASFSRTIHGPWTILVELIRNIDLLRQSALILSTCTFPSSGKVFVDRINSSTRQAFPTSLGGMSKGRLHSRLLTRSSNLISLFRDAGYSSISFYKTLFTDGVHFNAHDVSVFYRSSDACVLDKPTTDIFSIGFVECLAYIHDSNDICIVLMKTEIYCTGDTLDIQRRVIRCTNVSTGSILLSSSVIIRPSRIVRKLAFRRCSNNAASVSNTFLFFQYPNVQQST